MKRFALLFVLIFACVSDGLSNDAARLTLCFNPDWKFTKSNPVQAAEVRFDDSKWATVLTPYAFNDKNIW